MHPDHPLSGLMERLRYYAADKPSTPEHEEYRQLLARLECGLFERLPPAAIRTVTLVGANLAPSTYLPLIEIARRVAAGRVVPAEMLSSFYSLVRRHHGEHVMFPAELPPPIDLFPGSLETGDL